MLIALVVWGWHGGVFLAIGFDFNDCYLGSLLGRFSESDQTVFRKKVCGKSVFKCHVSFIQSARPVCSLVSVHLATQSCQDPKS